MTRSTGPEVPTVFQPAVCIGFALALGLAGCSTPSTSYGTVTTVAGIYTHIGSSGDGGPATSALLWDPTCVALDSAGNLYIGDNPNNNIRKVTAATGIITTYAGTRVHGYSGDNGPATSATMYGPTACALDAAGNLYIADDANNAIRKITAATGIITTVVGNGFGAGSSTGGFAGDGGPATSAEINHPFGVAVDATGNIYIADTSNYRVRKVNAATGIITTVAGTGAHGFAGDGGPAINAILYNPSGLAVDPSGNLYIADTSNNVVRRVDAKTGGITTIAGTSGTAGYRGDGVPATSTPLDNPQALAFDTSGNLYIADTGSGRIRRVLASSGIIQTVAGGGGQAGAAGDGGPATGAVIDNPWGIAFDTNGAMYIAQYAASVVRKVTPAN